MPKCLDKSEMAYLNFREAESPAKSSQFSISKLQRSTKPQTQNRPARHLPPASDFEVWCLRFGTSLELGAWCLVFRSEATQKLRSALRRRSDFVLTAAPRRPSYGREPGFQFNLNTERPE